MNRRVVALESRVETDGTVVVRRPDHEGLSLIPFTPLTELLAEGYEPCPLGTPPGVCGYPTVALWVPALRETTREP